MPLNPAFSLRRDPAASEPIKPDLQAEYVDLREKLEQLMAAPVRDFPAVDKMVNQLEMLQLAIKGEHGIKGNNPNE